MDALGDGDIFEKLKQKVTPEEVKKQDDAYNARLRAQFEKQQRRVETLLSANDTLPASISQVRVLNAPNTREAFLKRIVAPLLADHKDAPTTLLEARQAVDQVAHQLNKLDIYQQPISVFIDKAEPSNPKTNPNDLAVYYSAQEKSRYTIKTGTEAGHDEASAFVNARFRNLFGGAESLNAYYSKGTRTRSALSAFFDTPVLSNPDLRWEIGGLASTNVKPWASHEEVLKSGSTKLKYLTASGTRHEFQYSGAWRQITGLAKDASASVRGDAGDSFKSSLTHTYVNDKRDYPMLPTRGYLLKSIAEIAGYGPLQGDVAFGKVEVESQAALPVPIPGVEGESGASFTAGLRGGLLYPLPLGGASTAQPSRINDRFQLGGPADIRGFHISGLGPHQGTDSLGGDIYAAGGASLYLPLPRVGKDTPLRLQIFANAGRLLSLRSKASEDSNAGLTHESIQSSIKRAVQDIRENLPSAAAGVGIVYAHPSARIEVNFSLPLVMRQKELGRKGISLGVGIDFL